jgi:hypothetical protein
MPQQTKIFRTFMISTFTDIKEERRILQKKVFHNLKNSMRRTMPGTNE